LGCAFFDHKRSWLSERRYTNSRGLLIHEFFKWVNMTLAESAELRSDPPGINRLQLVAGMVNASEDHRWQGELSLICFAE
jgi:hypothetical protein